MLVRVSLPRAYTFCSSPGATVAVAGQGSDESAAPASVELLRDCQLFSKIALAGNALTLNISMNSLAEIEITEQISKPGCLILHFADGQLVSIETHLRLPSPFFFSFHQNSLILFHDVKECCRYTGSQLSVSEDFIYAYLMDHDALLACSPYKDIFTLPLGQNLVFGSKRCYLQAAPLSFGQATSRVDHFDDVASSILGCLKSYPDDSAILLSGGLDSSLIALVSNSDEKTRHMPLVHYTFGDGKAESEESYALSVARDCGRELHIVNQSTPCAVRLEILTDCQWPSKQSVFGSRLTQAGQLTQCTRFIDGFGGNEVFLQHPTIGTMLKSSVGSRHKRLFLLAHSEERLFGVMAGHLLALIRARMAGSATVSAAMTGVEKAYGFRMNSRLRRQTLSEVTRVCANFQHPDRDALFWYSVLMGASSEKRERLSAGTRIYSPLRDWNVIGTTLGIKAEHHIYPENRHFQRELIRHISHSCVAERYGKSDYKAYALLLLDRNIEKVQSLIDSSLGSWSIFDGDVLHEHMERRFYDGHDILLDLYSYCSFLEGRKNNATPVGLEYP